MWGLCSDNHSQHIGYDYALLDQLTLSHQQGHLSLHQSHLRMCQRIAEYVAASSNMKTSIMREESCAGAGGGGEAANFLVQILWSITLNNEVSPNSVWIVDYYSIQLIKKTKLVKSGYQWQ